MSDMKTIWHKLPEQPEKGRDVLEKWYHLGIHYTHFIAKNGIAEDNPFTDAWCYLDDLLALETELERTRKALDVAVDAIDKILVLDSGKFIQEPAEMWKIAKSAKDKVTAPEQKE